MATCEGAVEGVHEECCQHDLPAEHKDAPGLVCCWCGLLFEREILHGPYEPGLDAAEVKYRQVKLHEDLEQEAGRSSPKAPVGW